MNILHMKYAVEVARLGSLNKVAEALLVAQPNISRSIKELEADLGITIFRRSAKGMLVTPEGEEFIRYAESILKQIDAVESLYKNGAPTKQRFSVSAPRACYISEAFARFSSEIGEGAFEILYKENSSQSTLSDVQNGDCNLGIIRYAEEHDAAFKQTLEEKGLVAEPVAEFSYVLLMSRHHPLASAEEISEEALVPFIEVMHADSANPMLPIAKNAASEHTEAPKRRIYIFERAGQLDLLSANPEAFMRVSPVSQALLDRYDLVQKRCLEKGHVYKDVLIYRKNYRLSSPDKQFITSLCQMKREYVK